MKSLEECAPDAGALRGRRRQPAPERRPEAEGEIEPRQVERLREIGAWLTRYGESIYGTRGGPFKPGPWGASTHNGDRVYLHVWEWDGDGITLAPFGRTIRACRSLTGGKPILAATAAGTRITLRRRTAIRSTRCWSSSWTGRPGTSSRASFPFRAPLAGSESQERRRADEAGTPRSSG